jgi:hypothetical protein
MNENFQWMHNCIYNLIREFLKYLDAYLLFIFLKRICPMHILWTGLKCHSWPTLVWTMQHWKCNRTWFGTSNLRKCSGTYRWNATESVYKQHFSTGLLKTYPYAQLMVVTQFVDNLWSKTIDKKSTQRLLKTITNQLWTEPGVGCFSKNPVPTSNSNLDQEVQKFEGAHNLIRSSIKS